MVAGGNHSRVGLAGGGSGGSGAYPRLTGIRLTPLKKFVHTR